MKEYQTEVVLRAQMTVQAASQGEAERIMKGVFDNAVRVTVMDHDGDKIEGKPLMIAYDEIA